MALLVGCAVWSALLLSAAPALADGDPASDVLASQAIFLPADGGLSQAERRRLNGLLASARATGYPIRVALIATRADLGSVTALWRQPQAYAKFLGEELSLVYHGTLLVVMPNGVGIARVGGATTGAPARARRPAIASGGSLADTATRAVQELAAAAGHRLATPTSIAPRQSSGSALGSVDLGSWVALAAGAGMIALAWTVSVRARPPARLRRTR